MRKSRIDKALQTLDRTDSIPKASNPRLRTWVRRAAYIALGAAGSLSVAIAAASFPLSGLLIRPRLKRLSQLKNPRLRDFIRRLGIELEEVIIPSFDGTRLYGWWIEAAKEAPTVVILHGVKKNRTDVLRAALILRRAGFNTLVFDGRGHGSSEGRFVTYGFFERRDVEAAIEWVVSEKQISRDTIGLAGESMGAAIALQVAAHNPSVAAVWADSPFASLRRVAEEYVRRVTGLPTAVLNPVVWTTFQVAEYRGKFNVKTVDPLALAARITCPVFLVHGTADALIATDHSQNIHDALAGEKYLWFVKGVRHARASRHVKREYSARLTKFFVRSLRKAPNVDIPAQKE